MAADGPLGRGLALGVLAGCVFVAWRIHDRGFEAERPAKPAVAVAGDCASTRQAEIEQAKAAGRLTAEQAMMARQKVAKECAGR
jgi:hypothetical protein